MVRVTGATGALRWLRVGLSRRREKLYVSSVFARKRQGLVEVGITDHTHDLRRRRGNRECNVQIAAPGGQTDKEPQPEAVHEEHAAEIQIDPTHLRIE